MPRCSQGNMGDDDSGNNSSSESDTSTGDFGDQPTQIFDSQLPDSPSSSSGNKFNGNDADQFCILQSTIPFDDTALFEDEPATQLMDPDGETQLVNFGGETEAVNCDDDVEVMDILHSVENTGTQLFHDCDTEQVVGTDGEGTEKTELVDDTNEFSDDGSGRGECNNHADIEHTQHMDLCKEERKGYKSKADCGRSEQHTSGVGFQVFTSIRAASIRASGLAARNNASERSNCQSCSTLSSEPDNECRRMRFGRSPSLALEGSHASDALEKHNKQIDEPQTGSRFRFGRSTARKLFAEDKLADAKEASNNMNVGGADNSPRSFHVETEFAGLSYIDSQEPGEASQTNALDFVDNFLRVNIECNDEHDINKSTDGKSKPVLSAKGTRSLAESANLINAVGERGVFDWDDNREDDGGGEFFRKKKEAFFANGGRELKSSSSNTRSGRKVGESKNKKQLHIHEKIMGLVCSDSRLVLGNCRANDKYENSLGRQIKDAKFRKNLINELDKHSNLGFEDGPVGMPTNMDIQETTEVRFDTQMAAEAIEGLCFAVYETGQGSSKADEGSNYMPRGFHKGQVQEKTHTLESHKTPPLSNFGVRTRRSKLKRTGDESKDVTAVHLHGSAKVRNQRDIVPVKELKGFKSAAKKKVANNESNVEKRREMSLRRREVDTTPVASINQRTVKRTGDQSKEVTADHLHRPAKVRKQCDVVPPVKELKSVNSVAKENVANNESDVEKRSEASLKRREVDTTPVASTDQITVKKQSIQGNLGNFTPVACQTRQSVRGNESGRIKDASSDFREEINVLAGFYPKGTRKLSSARQEVGRESTSRLTSSKAAILSNSLDFSMKRKTRSSLGASLTSKHSCLTLLQQSEQGKGSCDINHCFNRNGNCHAYTLPSSEGAKSNPQLEESLRERIKPVASTCATPVNLVTPIKESSPICMGDEYLRQSSRKSMRSSLIQDLCNLAPTSEALVSPIKDTRKRRDVSLIHVIFSRHLDGEIVKQQKKILSRLGASESSSMSDATHFIADEFVRTRNMLEAIALGKPVVTHLWLESCGQACCHIDEKNFILRDAKKEKEFGFSLPVSLTRARQNPLLKGYRVLITPNTKPGKEILASLVKAVHGVAVERIGRSALKDDKVVDELLVVSCVEDYAACVPFLEKGAAIYSSELLLNGIVSQKLEFQRHRLFLDNVKRTRSTIWLKKDDNQYEAVGKEK